MPIMLGHAMPPAAAHRAAAGVTRSEPVSGRRAGPPGTHKLAGRCVLRPGKPGPLPSLACRAVLLSRGCPRTAGQLFPTLGAGVPPPSPAPPSGAAAMAARGEVRDARARAAG